ncbi:hypothetical protein LZC95_48310 [Pendulispora brunnea]|uniref:Uncharacterized protein n=1 Tax=Pendulispora brunnea TaxID=2905690 RepID=A0ABZ2KA43_9BACT
MPNAPATHPSEAALIGLTQEPAGIEWCGNGVDEDGDGVDLACAPTPAMPIVTKILPLTAHLPSTTIACGGEAVERGEGSGSYAVRFPRGVVADVHLVNDTHTVLDWTGHYGFGYLRVGEEVAVLDQPGHSLSIRDHSRVEHLYGSLWVEYSEPPYEPSPSDAMTLEGSAKVYDRTYDVRMTVTPRDGTYCTGSNIVHSVRAAAALEYGHLTTEMDIELFAPGTTESHGRFHFGIENCDPQTPNHNPSYVDWDHSSEHPEGRLALIGDELAPNGKAHLFLNGTPGHLTGYAQNLGGEFNLNTTLDVRVVSAR